MALQVQVMEERVREQGGTGAAAVDSLPHGIQIMHHNQLMLQAQLMEGMVSEQARVIAAAGHLPHPESKS